jgi:hypothetical protein
MIPFCLVRSLSCDRKAGRAVARLKFFLKKYKPTYRKLVGLLIIVFPFSFRTTIARFTTLVLGPIK